MSLRHTPRQHERDVRDVRLHDPHSVHPHSHSVPPLPPPPHMQVHPAHINGNGLPTPPATTNLPHHGLPVSQLVSPPVATVASNGVAVPPSIQKLAQANEQTWLLIGKFPTLTTIAVNFPALVVFGFHTWLSINWLFVLTRRINSSRSGCRTDGESGACPVGV